MSEYRQQYELGCLASIGLLTICAIPAYLVITHYQEKARMGEFILEEHDSGVEFSQEELEAALEWKRIGLVTGIMENTRFYIALSTAALFAVASQLIHWFKNMEINRHNAAVRESRLHQQNSEQ